MFKEVYYICKGHSSFISGPKKRPDVKKTSKIVKKYQKYFRRFSTFFAQGKKSQKSSKRVKNIFDMFRQFSHGTGFPAPLGASDSSHVRAILAMSPGQKLVKFSQRNWLKNWCFLDLAGSCDRTLQQGPCWAFPELGYFSVSFLPWHGLLRDVVKTQGKKKTHKHKQIYGIVPRLGGCQKFVYVFFLFGPSPMGEKKHINKIPPKSRDNPAKIMFTCFFLYVFFFAP